MDRTGREARLRAVCFDMDGVIVDSEPVHYEADRRAMAAHGVEFTAAEKKAKYIGRTVRGTMFELAEAHGIADAEGLLQERQDLFMRLIETDLKLRDGVPDLLASLSNRSVPFALVTSGNRSYIDNVFDRFDLRPLFSGMVTVEDVSAHKPAPDPYLAGASLLGVAPGHCMAVEDSAAGVASAKAAGMYCVAAPGEETRDADLSAADLRVDSLRELSNSVLDELFGVR